MTGMLDLSQDEPQDAGKPNTANKGNTLLGYVDPGLTPLTTETKPLNSFPNKTDLSQESAQ